MSKASYKIAAAVDIGPDSVNMKIAQPQGLDGIEILESLSQTVNLGEESYSNGIISFDTAENVSDILNNYYNLSKEYLIPREYISSIATTAIRDAHNRDYVIDQINVKTLRDITILDDAEEKSLMFREMLRRYKKDSNADKDYLMVYSGTGSVGVAATKEDKIVYSQNVNTDTLKLTKMTDDIESLTMRDFAKVIDEYLNYISGPIKRNLVSLKINSIVASGKEIDFIEVICKSKGEVNKNIIRKEELKKIYKDVSHKSSKYLEKTFNLPFEESKKMLIMIAFYIKLLDITKVSEIYNIGANMTDAILYGLLYKKKAKIEKREFDLSMVSSARFMAKKYSYDEKHSSKVEWFALIIFDNLKKVHGFSRRERLYLQTAAILHDIGKYVDSTNYDIATASLIKSSFIIGLNNNQKDVIANIARYHGNQTPSNEHDTYNLLTKEQKMMVSKLSAILRLADSLDYSRVQKIKSIELKLYEKRLSFYVKGTKDTTLEEWTFNKQSIFFEQVFGIKCEFNRKGMI